MFNICVYVSRPVTLQLRTNVTIHINLGKWECKKKGENNATTQLFVLLHCGRGLNTEQVKGHIKKNVRFDGINGESFKSSSRFCF